MINRNNIPLIESKFGKDWSIANENKGEIVFHCPFCTSKGHREHNDKKLYVNTNSLKWLCFRCESKGRISEEYLERDDISISNNLSDLILNLINNGNKDDDYEIDYYPIPKSKLIDNKNSLAYEYMKSRNFTDEMIDKYSLRVSEYDEFLGRVVIPNKIVSDNWTDYFTARDFVGSERRYKNPVNSKKNLILYNYHNIEDNPEYIILNEGPLNSIVAGDYSVASFGKTLSKEQLKLIIDKNPKRLYISYDMDAISQSKLVAKAVKELSNIEVYIVILPPSDKEDKINLDAVDLGRDRYLDIVFNNSKLFMSYGEYKLQESIINNYKVEEAIKI